MKNLLTILLVGLAIAGGIFAAFKTGQPKVQKETTPEAEAATALRDDGVIVTYFATDVRCPSCSQMAGRQWGVEPKSRAETPTSGLKLRAATRDG